MTAETKDLHREYRGNAKHLTGIAEFQLPPPGLPRAYTFRYGGFHWFIRCRRLRAMSSETVGGRLRDMVSNAGYGEAAEALAR
ncbi:hypothetical protein GCM10009566_73400 [Streptomyces murinus]